ncbi:hypothetical protein ZWY2020_035592 [Hordeum vulgare]|nr:hypothetical protein ZWY2020_035592 [Hordeum vulgare]
MDLCSCVWAKENSEFGNKSMEFSGSSGSFIYTPETQSEIATVIQGVLLEANEKRAEKRAGFRHGFIFF